MKFKIVCFYLSFIFISSCASFWGRNEELSKLHLNIGISNLGRGEFPGAIKELLIAKDLDGSNPAIYNYLGLAYFGRGRLDLAEENIRKCISMSPEYTEAYSNLSRVLIEKGDFPGAEASAQLGLKDLTFDQPERLYLDLGVALFWQKKYKEAITALSRSLDSQRLDCAANTWSGRAHFELNQLQKSIQFMDRALGSCNKSQNVDALFHGGWSYYKLGDRETAKDRWQRLIKEHPTNRNSEKAAKILAEIQ